MRTRLNAIIFAAILAPLPGAFGARAATAAESVTKYNAYTVITPPAAKQSATKFNAYTVFGPDPAKEVATKLNGYAVVGTSPVAETVTKVNGYSVLTPNLTRVTATKVSAYAVLVPPPPTQPSIYIFTKDRECRKPPALAFLSLPRP